MPITITKLRMNGDYLTCFEVYTNMLKIEKGSIGVSM